MQSFIVAMLLFSFMKACQGFMYQTKLGFRTSKCLYMGRAAAVRAATKARTDGAKAKKYNLFAKRIIIAVKAGGGPDPEVNRQLGTVIADAKAAQVPKDIINRNIERASASAGADYKQTVFEFYGHGGVGILVNVLTDNSNRATNDVNLAAKKNSLKPAAINSVKFKFDYKARLDLDSVISEDQLMEFCLEAGLDDYTLNTEVNGNLLFPSDEGKSVVLVELKDMASIRDVLRAQGFGVETSIAAVPKEGLKAISEEELTANLAAIDALESLDDVDSVEHNIDLTELEEI